MCLVTAVHRLHVHLLPLLQCFNHFCHCCFLINFKENQFFLTITCKRISNCLHLKLKKKNEQVLICIFNFQFLQRSAHLYFELSKELKLQPHCNPLCSFFLIKQYVSLHSCCSFKVILDGATVIMSLKHCRSTDTLFIQFSMFSFVW